VRGLRATEFAMLLVRIGNAGGGLCCYFSPSRLTWIAGTARSPGSWVPDRPGGLQRPLDKAIAAGDFARAEELLAAGGGRRSRRSTWTRRWRSWSS
jgi:hypothetical protein